MASPHQIPKSHFLLAGSHPYDATDETFLITQIIAEKSHPLHDLRPSLSEPLVGVVERAMERDIATRYGSAEEMRQALRQAIGKSDSASDSAPAPGTIIHVHGDLVGTEQETKGGEKMRIRILFLAADPTDASRLRLGEEFRELQEKLKRAKLRDQFGLELPQLSVRPADISQALLDVEPQIIHFSGHGSSTGALYFENLTGQIQLVQPNALAALFEQFANQVNCVLLNACYSEAQAKAIAEHIEYVVGMNQAISDKAAIAFAIGFYQALGAGRTIEEAYKLGCVQIGLQGIPEHLTPVLIRRA